MTTFMTTTSAIHDDVPSTITAFLEKKEEGFAAASPEEEPSLSMLLDADEKKEDDYHYNRAAPEEDDAYLLDDLLDDKDCVAETKDPAPTTPLKEVSTVATPLVTKQDDQPVTPLTAGTSSTGASTSDEGSPSSPGTGGTLSPMSRLLRPTASTTPRRIAMSPVEGQARARARVYLRQQLQKQQLGEGSAHSDASVSTGKSSYTPPATKKSTKPLTVPKAPKLSTSNYHKSSSGSVQTAPPSLNTFPPKVHSTKALTVPHAPKLSSSNRRSSPPRDTQDTSTAKKTVPRRQYGEKFVPTVPREPKFTSFSTTASTRRASAAAVETSPTSTTPTTKRREYGEKFVPTVPQGPKFSTPRPRSSSCRKPYEPQQPEAPHKLPRGHKQQNKPRPLTVPVGPKFLLDAKYGDKTPSPSGSNKGLLSDAESVATATTTRTTPTVPSRRTVTIPVAPKFQLDKKYGDKSSSPTGSTTPTGIQSASIASPSAAVVTPQKLELDTASERPNESIPAVVGTGTDTNRPVEEFECY